MLLIANIIIIKHSAVLMIIISVLVLCISTSFLLCYLIVIVHYVFKQHVNE